MRIVRITFTLVILTVGASLVMEDQVTTGALVATVVAPRGRIGVWWTRRCAQRRRLT
jgi:ABC-type bacteriocin/lantibiotic exporter with double-glycine peptidase domain